MRWWLGACLLALVPGAAFPVAAAANQATPYLAGKTPYGGQLGSPMSDVVELSGGDAPTGTLSFALYGPDTDCTTPVVRSTVTVSGNGTYRSAGYTPMAVGFYAWKASYSGDARNESFATTCHADGQDVFVEASTLRVVAGSDVGFGQPTAAMATLSGATATAKGMIYFTLFGPDDDRCEHLVAATTSRDITGDGTYVSGNVGLILPGTYRWTASYPGDEFDRAVAVTPCSQPEGMFHMVPGVPPAMPEPTPAPTATVPPAAAFAAHASPASGVRLALRLQAPAAGRVEVHSTFHGRRFAADRSVTVQAGDPITVRLKPGAAARRRLPDRRLRVRVRVRFVPDAGSARTKTLHVTVGAR